jgi:hypothetical protein
MLLLNNRRTTKGNKVFFTKKTTLCLQVKKLSSMFVSQSNNPLENDEIRTLKQTSLKNGNNFPVCFNSHLSVFIAIKRKVQKNKKFHFNPNPKTKMMKTLTQNLLKALLVLLVSASTIASNASVNTVPVKPASFTADFNNNNTKKVDLKWSTEIETNLSHFIVERSTDGVNFSDAALVFAYGNTTAKSDYAFADNISRIVEGSVYYRVISISDDGKTVYSDVRIIKINK